MNAFGNKVLAWAGQSANQTTMQIIINDNSDDDDGICVCVYVCMVA